MIISIVAQRYAEAVFASVPETEREAFMTDVRDFAATVAKSRELQVFLDSPVIERAKKRDVVEALCNGRFGDWMQRVLMLLIDKGREGLSIEIMEALVNLYRTSQGIRKMSVATAVDLPDDMRETMRAGLMEFSKSGVEIDYTTDSQLLGGAVVRIGDTVYDGSVVRQLARLRHKFITA